MDTTFPDALGGDTHVAVNPLSAPVPPPRGSKNGPLAATEGGAEGGGVGDVSLHHLQPGAAGSGGRAVPGDDHWVHAQSERVEVVVL